MAVALATSGNAKVRFGDIAALAGLTNLTIAITIKMNAAPAGLRICGQWGAAGDRSFLMQVTNTDEIGCVLYNAGGGLYGIVTTGTNLASGSQYRIVVRFGALTGSATRDVWVNGTSVSVVPWLDDLPGALQDGAGQVYCGYETESSSQGEDADFSEFAIWGAKLSDADCAAYGKGISPNLLSPASRILYAPMLNTSMLQDVWGQKTGTNTSGTNAPHPSTLRSRGARARRFSTASASGAISGTSAGSATVAGTLTGAGAAAGTSAGTGTPAGTLAGAGALAGSAAGAATASGTLTGAGACAGTAAGVGTPSATCAGAGALVATSAGTSTVSGTLLVPDALAGTIVGTSTAAGTLTGAGAASGSVAGTATCAGTLGGAVAAVGAAAGLASTSGEVYGVGELVATVVGQAVAVALLVGFGALAGTAGGTSTVSGSEGTPATSILSPTGARHVATGIDWAEHVATGLDGARHMGDIVARRQP